MGVLGSWSRHELLTAYVGGRRGDRDQVGWETGALGALTECGLVSPCEILTDSVLEHITLEAKKGTGEWR